MSDGRAVPQLSGGTIMSVARVRQDVADAEAGRAVQDDGPEPDVQSTCRCIPVTPGGPCGCPCHRAHEAEPTGDLALVGAVQDDGLPTVERMTEALDRVWAMGWIAMPDHQTEQIATTLLDVLRAAPSLHDPQEDAHT